MRVAAKPLVALRKLRHALGGVCLGLAASLLPTGAALAEKGLPKPYVSPALYAVLLPITAEVRKAFRLGKKAAGVVVVSVDPGGTGELYGLEPGEVVTKLDGKMDLSRFRSGLLRAILAIKGTGYGTRTQRRVQTRCGSDRADQRLDDASGCV